MRYAFFVHLAVSLRVLPVMAGLLSGCAAAPAPEGPQPLLPRAPFFRAAFNASKGRPRLLMIISPTCGACLKGGDAVQKYLAAHPEAPLDVYAVWLPAWSEPDTEAAAESSSHRLTDPRIRQYWDGDKSLAMAIKAQLAWDNSPFAWDIYLLYGPEAVWGGTPPEPFDWVHQTYEERSGPHAQRFRGGHVQQALEAMMRKLKPESP